LREVIKRKFNLTLTISLVILQFFSSSVFAGFLYLPLNKSYTPVGYVGSYPGHTGTDYRGAGYGTLVYAAYSGTVVATRETENDGCDITRAQQLHWGNYVKIDHQIGSSKYRTEYWHLKQNGVVVSVGQKVETGDLIAYISNSGLTVGSDCAKRPDLPFGAYYHLHFEVKKWNGNGWTVLNPYAGGSGWLWTTNPPTPSTQVPPPLPPACSYSVGQNSSRKDLFEQAYSRNGGKDGLGCPLGTATYWWGGLTKQEFTNAGIIYNSGADAAVAYVVKSGIWKYYRSYYSNSNLGGPISDEFVNSFGKPQTNFRRGFIWWDGSSAHPVVYGDWYWITQGADTTLDASFENAEGGGVQLILDGKGGTGGWVSPQPLVGKEITDVLVNQDSLFYWEQFDITHYLQFGLLISGVDLSDRLLVYSANSSNHWNNFGWVDMDDGTQTYGQWESFSRNLWNDYRAEFGINPIKVKEFRVGHAIKDIWVGDHGGTVKNIVFDYELPQTEIEIVPDFPDGGEGWYQSPPLVSLTAIDDASGIDRIEYNLGSGWHVYNEPFQIDHDGIFQLQYRAVDRAGRIETPKSHDFKVDTSDPQTQLNSFGPSYEDGEDRIYVSDQTNFELDAIDETSGVSETTYSYHGPYSETESQPYTETFSLESDEGLNTIVYQSSDNAGNVEEANSQDFYLDSTAPASTDDSDGQWHNEDVIVTITSSDPDAPDETTGSGEQKINYSGSQGGEVLGDQARVTFTDEGTHDLTYYATDNVGNVEKANQAAPINIDKTPPEITGESTISPNENDWYNEDVIVHFDANDQDNLSGLKSVTPDTVVSTEGANQEVIGIAEDNAGNAASTIVSGINIDKTPPTIEGSISTESSGIDLEGRNWYNEDVTIHFEAADQEHLSGVKSITPDVEVSTEGVSQEIIGAAEDYAGNAANTVVSGVNIDKTAPESSLNLLNSNYNNQLDENPIEIDFSYGDALSGVKRVGLYKRQPDQDWEHHWTSPAGAIPDHFNVWSLPVEGRWEFSSRATDFAGNKEGLSEVAVTSIVYDITPPVSEVKSVEEGEYYNTWPEIFGTADDINLISPLIETSGIAQVEVRIDINGGEGEWIEVAGTDEWTLADFSSEDGFYTIYSRATDRAGNQMHTYQVSFVYDSISPVTSGNILGSLGMNSWYVSPTNLELTTIDLTAGVFQTFYQVGDADLKSYVGPLSFVDGLYTVEFWSVDKAGNEEDHQLLTLKVDTAAPAVPAASVSGGSFFEGEQLTISLTGEDASQIYYSINGENEILYITTLIISDDALISAYAIDESGNRSAKTSWNFVFGPKSTATPQVLGASAEFSRSLVKGEPLVIVEDGSVQGELAATNENFVNDEINQSGDVQGVEIIGGEGPESEGSYLAIILLAGSVFLFIFALRRFLL
jgi:hypothetical protein